MNNMKENKKAKCCLEYSTTRSLLTCLSSIIMFFLFSTVHISAETYVHSKRLTINNTSESLIEIFNEIESNSEFHFFYDNDENEVSQKTSFSVYNSTIKGILDIMFKDSEIKFEANNRSIILPNKIHFKY